MSNADKTPEDSLDLVASLLRKLAIAEKENTILKGSFFAETNTVWGFEQKDFRGSFDAICRQEGYYKHIFSYKRIVYAVTRATKALDPRLDSVAAKSRSTKTGSTKTGAGYVGLNFLGTEGFEIAHQGFPSSKTCIPAYGVISQAILGFDAEGYCAEKLQKKDDVIKTLQHLVCGGNSRSPGLRDVSENHLHMPRGHCRHYDDNPDWIIVPIMTTEQMKTWKRGTGYSVMVLAENPAAYKDLITKDYSDTPDGILKKCSETEAKVATQLLGDFIKANADVLLGRPRKDASKVPTSSVTPFDLLKRSKTIIELDRKIEALKTTKLSLSSCCVKVPEMKAWDDEWEILKVSLTGNEDPASLAQKAAINVSSRNEQKLLPTCPVVEEEEENPQQAYAYALAESDRLERQFVGNWVSVSDALDNESLSDNEEEFPLISVSGSDGWDNESLSGNESYVCPDDCVEDSEPRRVSLD